MNKPIDEEAFREAYIALEGKMTADDRLKERTKSLVSKKRAQPSPSGRRSSRFSEKNPLTRRLLPFAACLALVGCIGFAGITQGASVVTDNQFTLVAYADEAARQENGGTALSLERCYPGVMEAGYRYDSASGETDRSTVDVSLTYAFDLTVQGANIDSLEYYIDGPDANFVTMPAARATEGRYSEDNPAPEIPGDVLAASFAVPFEGDESVVRTIRFDYVLEEPQKSAYDSLYERHDEPESTNELMFMLLKQGAERMSDTVVTVTATFEDGTKQTKSYGFEPVEGHDEIVEQMAYGTWDYANHACLFVLMEK